ncbi:SDR family oxidoreductase [Pseudomonas sp. NPDC088368]|jgi:nucleoside-diphosphate-sugar epimerase|uniref:SDR family oxidoreductase n=1 Tax=Pseudomonas sp. NPDC088368 TaxID=3364453 RepID=UPI003804F041
MTETKTALVVGASGIIGNAVTRELLRNPRWNVRATRRALVTDVEIVHCDITDAEATAEALKQAKDTTHVFYAALVPHQNAQVESTVNTAMLANVLDGLKQAGANLERVVLFQGAKVYGPHLGGPISTPFYEDAPRHLAANFYFAQEDLLRARARAGELEWSILRPDPVIGDIAGNIMNIAMVIAVYAALSKQAGVPLRFPGALETYSGVLAQVTDADWLARASLWAAADRNARNEAFNLVGEPFRWNRLWQKVADAFELELAEPQPVSLSQHMPDKAEAWQRLVDQHDLKPVPYQQLVNWGFGDFVFSIKQDMLSDMGKIRRAGFTLPMKSPEASLIDTIFSLRQQKYIP